MHKIFISYSHKDEDWKDRLVSQLGVLQQQDKLTSWDDRQIAGGDDWLQEIEAALDSCHVAVLLISADFLTSNFILNREVPILLQRRKQQGVRLAELIRQQKTLLILDGLEPLQYPPGQMQGELKDQGLKALLKELSRANLGLCIVTTRVALKDIVQTEGKSSRRVALENLSAEAGSQLLQHLGVKGTHAELVEAAQEFGSHALALNLLGRYLAVVHAGEIRKRDLIPSLEELPEKEGRHARKVMASYELWLKNTPELDILYLMGLFDRPAAGGAIQALLASTPIEGLTSHLSRSIGTNLQPAGLQFAVQHLRDLRLLAEKDVVHPDTLDCHPLVREHFGETLRQQNQAAWKEAHSRLYEYYKKLPAKNLPDTLEEMEPLFAAVAHGCQAGRHQEALDDVYWKRIYRESKFFVRNQLGAFGSDLAALSNFFEIPWNQPASGFTDEAKAVILNFVGTGLRALGRLREASQSMQAGLEAIIDQKNWRHAAIQASNLSELYLTLGEVNQALASAHQSVDFADRSGDGFRKYYERTTLADALRHAGDLSEAENLFSEAEAMLHKRQPEYLYLYSLQGFRFCDLLLSQGQYQEVQKRARQTIEIAKRNHWLLDIALDKLSFGRAFLLQALAEATDPSLRASAFNQAGEYLQQAVTGLREAGVQDHVVRGLFARAAFYREQNEFAPAWADLEEAGEIAERGEMKLFLADYHLEACRLCLAEGGGRRAESVKRKAQEHLAIAKEMIEKMGYSRRRPEVEELQKAIEKL